MLWPDERYVRIYTRDTLDWTALGWEAQALFVLLLRKVDRSGVLELGRHGLAGLAELLRMPTEVVERAFPRLLEDGCVTMRGTTAVVKNFLEAQETAKSDAARKREQRERKLKDTLSEPPVVADMSRAVTHVTDTVTHVTDTVTHVTEAVTDGPTMSLRAVPCRAVPSVPSVPCLVPEKPADSPLDMPRQEQLLEAPKGKKPNPRHVPMVKLLCDEFERVRKAKYRFTGKDAKALSELLGSETDADILDRWRRGLTSTGYAKTDDIAALASKWNGATGPPAQRDWARGRVGAEEIDKSKLKAGDLTDAF